MQSKVLLVSSLLAALSTGANAQCRPSAAELGPGITATTAAPSVLSKLADDIEAYDHVTLGEDPAVESLIYAIIGEASAFPTPVGALEAFRSELNNHPTDFIVDYLEKPSAAVGAIASLLPTDAPFPQALAFISSVVAQAENIASIDLGYITTQAAENQTKATPTAVAASVSSAALTPVAVSTGSAPAAGIAGVQLVICAVAAVAGVMAIAIL
ncbi:hypothetical protein MMC24_002982 [Lignoscripta atroalba]|nr:hypothetical protein [Lignoscripta atroalba]